MGKISKPYVTGQSIVVKYEYPGFTVHIHTDYVNGIVSIVEPEQQTSPVQYKAKKWLFQERKIEFLSGWQYIFDCLSDAVGLAEEDLKAYQVAQSKRKTDKLIDLLSAAQEAREQ